MSTVVLTRSESMPGFGQLELDEVHTPSSDYSFAQANMLSSTASGIFSLCHTGPADLAGSAWDSTAEGPQNFPEMVSDQGDFFAGDAEDFVVPFGPMTPKMSDHSDGMDDMHAKWTTAGAVDKAAKAEPMRRLSSKSSTGSHKHGSKTIKASSSSHKKSRARVQSILTHTSAQLANLNMTGNTSAFHEGPMGGAQPMHQFLSQDLDTLPVSSQMATHGFYGMIGMEHDGLPYVGDVTVAGMAATHLNPQMFNPGMAGNSPSQSWGSESQFGGTRTSSPGVPDGIPDDIWSAGNTESSPPESAVSDPLEMSGQSPRMNRKLDGSHFVTSEDLHGSALTSSLGDDAYSLPPPAFGSRRLSGEGESSARDHYLYKNVMPNTDGLFHCPWEGQASCNHKAEKLKCNYDKFVDSHLKPYRCKVEGCQTARFSSTACLLRHEREAHAMHGHGEKPYLCTHEGCERAVPGHGFPRQWNLRDHMRRVHNDSGPAVPAATTSSPPAGGSSSATATSRGRRKKAEQEKGASASQESTSTSTKSSSRKNAKAAAAENSAAAAAAAAAAATAAAAAAAAEGHAQREADQWYENQRALLALVQGFTHPDDAQCLQNVKEAQSHLSAMAKISRDMTHKSSGRGSWKQSG